MALTREFLLSIRTKMRVCSFNCQTLRALNIHKPKHVRGCRSKKLRDRHYYDFPTITLTNARSLCNKMSEFDHFLSTHKVDIACVSETWFKPSGAEFYNCEGYTMFSKSRETQQGGGVAAYVSIRIPTRQLNIQVPPNLECLWLHIRPHLLPRSVSCIILAVLYNPPLSQNEDNLLDHLVYTTDLLRQRYPDCGIVITGDFNTLKPQPLVYHLGLKQVVTFRTQVRSTNILDRIYTNIASKYQVPIERPPLGASDHVNIIWRPQLNAPAPAPHHTPRFFRPLTDTNVSRFTQMFDSLPLGIIDNIPDPSNKVNFLQQILQFAYTNSCPERMSKMSHNDKPWMTPQIKSLLRIKRVTFNRFGTNSQYKKIRNKLAATIKRSKKQFYRKKVEVLHGKNPRLWHRHVKQICGNTISSPAFLQSNNPTDINKHFATICSSLPPLNHNSISTSLVEKDLPVISTHDLYRCILRLDERKALHPNDIPTRLIKAIAFSLSIPLAKIMNTCLQLGQFPCQWKNAVVTPVAKTKAPNSFNDLRPIAITPCFAKLWEKMITPHISQDIYPSVDTCQFGNMPGLSTRDYLTRFIYHIIAHTDKPESAASACLIDFSKAFDRVNHTIAVNKLIKLGLRSSLIPSVCAFLEGRTQQTKLKGLLSPSLPITCGLPQGTLLGPLLFLALINDCAPSSVLRYKYVDDLTILELRSRHDQSNLGKSLDEVAQWAFQNDMLINFQKSSVIHFDFSRHPTPQAPILITGKVIPTTTKVKLLGLNITSDLKWDEHINDLILKASGRLQMLRLAKQNGVPQDHLLDIYYAYVRPSVEYAVPVWATSLSQGHD